MGNGHEDSPQGHTQLDAGVRERPRAAWIFPGALRRPDAEISAIFGRFLTCALGAIVLIVSPSGCSGKKATLTRERGYPLGASRNAVLDIQVRREGTTLRATNTSARAFGPSLFWINKSHRLPIEAWGVGETITLDLEDFRDEFGDAFRAGGFFASEKPDPVVLAEVEVEGPAGAEVVGLVAIAERK